MLCVKNGGVLEHPKNQHCGPAAGGFRVFLWASGTNWRLGRFLFFNRVGAHKRRKSNFAFISSVCETDEYSRFAFAPGEAAFICGSHGAAEGDCRTRLHKAGILGWRVLEITKAERGALRPQRLAMWLVELAAKCAEPAGNGI